MNARVADQTYRAKTAAQVLGVSRATFYRIKWFRSKKVRMSDGTVGYLASDIALYQAMRRGQ
jgi:predicted DNA-binding transcriptional regulator AlpA